MVKFHGKEQIDLSLSLKYYNSLSKYDHDYFSTGWYRGFALKNPNIKVTIVISNYNYEIY